MDQLGKVANPARGQLMNVENEYFSVPIRAREYDLASSAFPFCIGLLLLHTQAESGAYFRISRDLRGGVHLLFKPPYAIGSVPSLLGHANAHRWCSLPRIRQHRARSPQGSSNNGCCLSLQVTID